MPNEENSAAAAIAAASADVQPAVGSSTTAGPSGEKAYNELLPEFDAVESLTPITVDIPSAVALVIGSLPEIEEVVPELQKVSPEITLEEIEKLRRCALALNYAHARWLSAAPPENNLNQLIEDAGKRFAKLSADVSPLRARGYIKEGELEDLGGPKGHKEVAVALTRFVTVLKANWARIEGKCAVTMAELDETLSVAELILTAIGLKEQGAARSESATDYRLRAFTVFSQRYDRIRQAVNFVRWRQRDADQIAPSIYKGRQRRRSGSPSDDPNVPDGPDVPVPPAGGQPPSPNIGVSPAAMGTIPASVQATQISGENPEAGPWVIKPGSAAR